ncbi:zinc transporter ZntB [Pseudodonghicola flavimaris]|uniref:Zinc transporter ZntB n=1 Tax=Pseudodonghicola flavimaris TaxID=3050036 RepID=A0ABT7F5X4_9RHOB|nr:zinc transporter ZntB [Pseudodonghicola flavimaris]MDK3020003.1 zinc transporter ZntB [Pseudodonghicola flavimaris]
MDEIRVYGFDGKGGARPLPTDRLRARDPAATGSGFVWAHVDGWTAPGRDWLVATGMEPLELEAMLAEETRPRCAIHGDIVLVNLRGVNLTPGAEPEDMISLRLFISEHVVITTQMRDLQAVDDLMDSLDRGAPGPVSPGDLIARLALRLADRAEPVVAALNERADKLEDAVDAPEGPGREERAELADIRREAILLRRYMFPQRDALSTLEIEDLAWLTQRDRGRLREATERVTRLAEELDAIRDRAQVVQDQITDLRAEAMNRQMLLLSVVAAIFLPMSLLTGLLGINVGGIPGAHSRLAFWLVCLLLVAMGVGLGWLFRRLGLLGK